MDIYTYTFVYMVLIRTKLHKMEEEKKSTFTVYTWYMQDKRVPTMYIVHIKQKVDFISKPDQDSQRRKYIYKYMNTALYKTG